MPMTISWLGAFLTFQVTFTELFIAATVIFAVGYKHGWKSAAVGSVVGAAAIVLASAALAALGRQLPTSALDWISSLLLLSFGIFLLYGFWRAGPQPAPEAAPPSDLIEIARPVNLAGVGIAAWGMFVEGLEIMVVWLAIALKQGAATATAGVLLGFLVIAAVALLLGRIGIFRRVPARYLDLIAGVMVTIYGIYFLVQAVAGQHATA
jgi:uncharacterized membrane protein